MNDQPEKLNAWLYPADGKYKLTIGPHIDEPIEEAEGVRTYHEAYQISRLYGATPRNF